MIFLKKKKILFFIASLFAGFVFVHDVKGGVSSEQKTTKTEAEWTIVTYIQSDNNLYYFSNLNISSMEEAGSTDQVNILVQWDQPQNKKTWRYKIEKGGQVDAGSLNQEMGVNPEREIVECMQWAKVNYPAKHYMLVLWNHGGGVIDRLVKVSLSRAIGNLSGDRFWLEVPGLASTTLDDRGILYDDSDHTFLNNQGLANALTQIKGVLGKNLDILGMDACLMAMIEIAYQVKETTDYLVAAENVEAGEGWDYAGFLKPLVANPTAFSSDMLAKTIVESYSNYYEVQDPEYTLSAINVNKIDNVVSSMNDILILLDTCNQINKKRMDKIFKNVRRRVSEFAISDYIDLDTFYAALSERMSVRIAAKKTSIRFKNALDKVRAAVEVGRKALADSVSCYAAGSQYPDVKGLSIYYPTTSIHSSYQKTLFAQNSRWYSFLQKVLRKG
ncbi:MAG: clostripain-related cysteine peptidase [bacterium]